MTKENIIDYVMNSPQNTNKAVLRSMLNDIGGDSGDSQFALVEANIVADPSDPGIGSDTTYSELVELNNAGKIIIVKLKDNTGQLFGYCALGFYGNVFIGNFQSYTISVDSTGWHLSGGR